MLLAILIPSILLVTFIYALAREDKLRITLNSYPGRGDSGFHLTGKVYDPVTNYSWRNLWLHFPKGSYYFKFRVYRWMKYD